MDKKNWIKREEQALEALGLKADLSKVKVYSEHHYFIPEGLTCTQLIELAKGQGIKIGYQTDSVSDIPTEGGILECNLSELMTPTDANHRPFNLNAEEQEAWAAEQGGDGLTSAEETLYLIIRAFLAFGRIPFMGGWIRCRNSRQDGDRLGVEFDADDGLFVGWGSASFRSWRYGAVARKFSLEAGTLAPLETFEAFGVTYLKSDLSKLKPVQAKILGS